MAEIKVSKFEIAEYLHDDELIAEFVNSALEEGDIEDLISALGNIAKAKRMTIIANEIGISRPSLYKALSKGSKPQFETIHEVIKALGGNLNVTIAYSKSA